MIFVTVGTTSYSFDRLLRAIDDLIETKKIKEKVIAQIGDSDYEPKNYEFFRFTSSEEIQELNKKCNLVISHAGAGSIMLALENKKPVVVVPRLKKYNEHVNDHQIELTNELEKQGRIIGVYDISELDNKIKKIRKIKKKKFPKSRIPEIIENFIKTIS